jgi:hypothetical protein
MRPAGESPTSGMRQQRGEIEEELLVCERKLAGFLAAFVRDSRPREV